MSRFGGERGLGAMSMGADFPSLLSSEEFEELGDCDLLELVLFLEITFD